MTSRRVVTVVAMILVAIIAVVLFFASGSDAMTTALPSEPSSLPRPALHGALVRWLFIGLTSSATILLTLRPRLGRVNSPTR